MVERAVGQVAVKTTEETLRFAASSKERSRPSEEPQLLGSSIGKDEPGNAQPQHNQGCISKASAMRGEGRNALCDVGVGVVLLLPQVLRVLAHRLHHPAQHAEGVGGVEGQLRGKGGGLQGQGQGQAQEQGQGQERRQGQARSQGQERRQGLGLQ